MNNGSNLPGYIPLKLASKRASVAHFLHHSTVHVVQQVRFVTFILPGIRLEMKFQFGPLG